MVIQVKEVSDYDMGYDDFLQGLPPIPDIQDTEEDMEYMRGYNQAKKNLLK